MNPTSTTRARTRAHPFALSLVFALTVGACAAKQPAPGAMERPLGDLESALQELDRAEGELAAIFPGISPGAPPVYATPPAGAAAEAPQSPASAPPPPSAATDEARAATPAREAGAGAAAAPTSGEDACTTACRALASMERAAAHLCGLAGEADPRCEGARTRVSRAGDRVRGGCPSCG